MQHKLRIAIDAALVPGRLGGVETVLLGLVKALGALNDGAEEYVLAVSPDAPDWLDAVRGDNQQVAVRPRAPAPPPRFSRAGARELARRTLRRVAGNPPPAAWPEVPISDGFFEGLGCDVVHFPTQVFTLCALPSIYNPHDLQHVHYPHFFSARELAWRDVHYRAGCRFSRHVVVASQWIAEDIERELGVPARKLQVIPWAPPTQAVAVPAADARREVLAKHGVTPPYALYPAVTWEHKNHVRLLEALALLRARDGMHVRLVCTGHRHEPWWPRVQAVLDEHRLHDQVHFLGRLPAEELRALYAEAQFVAIPTLFEAASAPMFEAWLERAPVTCSTVTSLPEQAGDAALLFDALSVEAIADALRRMASDEALRRSLVEKGTRRLADFGWERTARAYRAMYRSAARAPLSAEDEELLGWDWMRGRSRDRVGVT